MLLQHAVLSYHCTVVLCGVVGLAYWPVCHPTIRSVRVELSCLLWYSSAQCCVFYLRGNDGCLDRWQMMDGRMEGRKERREGRTEGGSQEGGEKTGLETIGI